MKRTLLLPLLLVAGCAAGFVALWVSRGALGAWAVPAALGWGSTGQQGVRGGAGAQAW